MTMRSPSLAVPLLARLVIGPGALGCGGPTTSLDDPHGTAGAETRVATTEASETTGEPPASDAPVVCDAACTAILTRTWAVAGPWGSTDVVEMLREADDGSLWLGTRQLDGRVGLMRVSAAGALAWYANPGLTCERCELVDIALHPSGDVLLSAIGREDLAPDQAVVARYDPSAGEVVWVRTLALRQGEGTRPRLGELAVLHEDRIVVLRVDGTSTGERLELLDVSADGTFRSPIRVRLQSGTGDAWHPLVAAAPTGEAVLAHAWWDAVEDRVTAATTRVVPPRLTLSRVPLPLHLDDLAVDALGQRFELAHARGSESITLVLTSRLGSDPERWRASLPLLSTSSTRAALALGPDGSVYAAARTTPRAPPGRPYEELLAVARWSADGTLRWQATHPMDLADSLDPLELAIDDAHGLLVGTVARGQPTVVRYEPGCACE
jgi:hypothetical protein